MEIRRLEPSDDRSRFNSGHPDLDRYFRLFAGQNQFRHQIGVTYVAVEGQWIAGFATVSPSHLETDSFPAGLKKGLPQYPIPVLRLARLAVDQGGQRAGLGSILLRFVMELGLKMSEAYGCFGILVDAVPGAEGFYERMGFVFLNLEMGEARARPRPKTMFLPLGTIRNAGGKL